MDTLDGILKLYINEAKWGFVWLGHGLLQKADMQIFQWILGINKKIKVELMANNYANRNNPLEARYFFFFKIYCLMFFWKSACLHLLSILALMSVSNPFSCSLLNQMVIGNPYEHIKTISTLRQTQTTKVRKTMTRTKNKHKRKYIGDWTFEKCTGKRTRDPVEAQVSLRLVKKKDSIKDIFGLSRSWYGAWMCNYSYLCCVSLCSRGG